MMFFLVGLMASAQTPTTFFNDLDNFKNKSLSLKTENQYLDASSDNLLSRQLFWTPRLTLSATQSEKRVDDEKTFEGNYWQADASLNLFRAGSDYNSLQGAKAEYKAQNLKVHNQALDVEVKAADLIFKSLYLNEVVRIQEQILKLKQESLKIATDRYRQGKFPSQEVTKSEVDLILQKNRLRTAQLDSAENKSQIMSLFIANIQTKTWPFADKATPRLPEATRLPLVEQKYWLSQSRENSWRSSRGGHWPSVDLQVQYQESPIKERTTNQLVGLLTLSLPLWSQYETAAKVSSAYAQYIDSLNDFRNTEQSLKQKTLFLKEKMETARLNLVEAKKNLETSRKLYQAILSSFRYGRVSTNDLFIEQNRLLESENTLALSQLTFHQSLIETCALAGSQSAECLR